MIYTIACFKRLWKKKMKEIWLRFCLINISGWSNKFAPDNRFGETINILNKKNMNSSVNRKSNEILWNTVLQNVLLLCNGRKALSQATRSTKHGNRYSTVDGYSDVCYFVKLLTKKTVFHD